MESEHTFRNILLVFLAAVMLYVVAFTSIEHLRTRKGGWHVTFLTDATGEPKLIVNQPRLGLSNISLDFPSQKVAMSNLNETVVFDRPITNVPFGIVAYLDTTFLPGAILLRVFDHEIQLTPRLLIVDDHKMIWQNEQSFAFSPVNKSK
jgi:hypothetical protein